MYLCGAIKPHTSQTMLEIRMANSSDVPALKDVLDSIDLFPSEMLEDMMAPSQTDPESQDIWFTAEREGTPIALGYCRPEPLTEGTFNLLAIGVHSQVQSKGTGGRMMAFIEAHLTSLGHRVLIVETSSTDAFEGTRRFYEHLGYTQEAVIRDFWSDGDHKVVYWKKLR